MFVLCEMQPSNVLIKSDPTDMRGFVAKVRSFIKQ
jgi:hypothetical protein